MPVKNKPIFLLVLLGVAITLVVVATGFILKNHTEKLTPIQEPGKTELKDKLVSGFPEFPVYQGATIVSSYQKQEGERKGFEASWEVGSTVNEIMAWYMDILSEFGWIFEKKPDLDNLTEQQLIAVKDGTWLYLTVERKGLDKAEIVAEFPVQ